MILKFKKSQTKPLGNTGAVKKDGILIKLYSEDDKWESDFIAGRLTPEEYLEVLDELKRLEAVRKLCDG